MFIFAVALLVIEVIITFYTMRLIMGMIIGLPNGFVKHLLLKLLMKPLVGFMLNFMISTALAWFCGSGLSAGFANLASSIVIGLLMPVYFQKVYKVRELMEHLQTVGVLGCINRRRTMADD